MIRNAMLAGALLASALSPESAQTETAQPGTAAPEVGRLLVDGEDYATEKVVRFAVEMALESNNELMIAIVAPELQSDSSVFVTDGECGVEWRSMVEDGQVERTLGIGLIAELEILQSPKATKDMSIMYSRKVIHSGDEAQAGEQLGPDEVSRGLEMTREVCAYYDTLG